MVSHLFVYQLALIAIVWLFVMLHDLWPMAAGLTDRVWSLREVLMFRVPPWPQPQTL